ncbi:hypothetical protein YC2023_118553 [Brassica napus]
MIMTDSFCPAPAPVPSRESVSSPAHTTVDRMTQSHRERGREREREETERIENRWGPLFAMNLASQALSLSLSLSYFVLILVQKGGS